MRTQSLRPKGKKRSGGQPGHKGTTRLQVSRPDEVVVHAPSACAACGVDLNLEEVCGEIERQVFDIPEPKLIVTAHRAQSKVCPCCQHKTQGAFPAEVTSSTQYGPRLRAYAIYLSVQHFIPEDRLQTLLQDCFGAPIATASMADWNRRFAQALTPFMAQLQTHVNISSVAHLDETGFRVGGKTQWLHVVSTPDAACYRVSPKRKDIAPLQGLRGTLIHDHWKPYYADARLKLNDHALCNAHHLRELKAVRDLDRERWARWMIRLLLLANGAQHQHDGLVPFDLACRIHRCYDKILNKALAWHAQQAPFGNGRAKRTGHNLALRLLARKNDALRFMHDADVPFTHNSAEQALRMMKVKQKISGGFRTSAGANDFATIRSFIATAAKNAYNILHAIMNPDAFCFFKWGMG